MNTLLMKLRIVKFPRIGCALAGHRWRKERRERQDILVCRRCGYLSSLEEETHKQSLVGFAGGGGGVGGDGGW